MAEYTKEDVTRAVERALADVSKEAKGSEKLFTVADLKSQAEALAGGGDLSAWEISYSTAANASIQQLREAAKVGAQSAWTISYSTASAAPVERRQ